MAVAELPFDDGSPRRAEPTPYAGPMTEAQFQRAIVDLARDCGWLVQHAQPTRSKNGKWLTSGAAGFPDLVLLRPPELLFLELKSASGDATAKQKQWISRLQRVPGVDAYIVRPADCGRIFARLMRPPPR